MGENPPLCTCSTMPCSCSTIHLGMVSSFTVKLPPFMRCPAQSIVGSTVVFIRWQSHACAKSAEPTLSGLAPAVAEDSHPILPAHSPTDRVSLVSHHAGQHRARARRPTTSWPIKQHLTPNRRYRTCTERVPPSPRWREAKPFCFSPARVALFGPRDNSLGRSASRV